MAISMVREPSAEPNITNVDDIIGLRYAYGNQNGFIIGKGNEISYTLNGSTLTINSGRMVLNGVECDIDANGVSITVDNVATKRYYSVYLQINLNTNTVSILNTYATGDYPSISAGDDLTANPTGTARMTIYRFTAQSGVISNITKVIQSIKYTSGVVVNDAVNADNGVKVSNGTHKPLNQDSASELLTVGSNSVVQSKSLFYNLNSNDRTVNLSGVSEGDTIEVVLKVNLTSLGYVFVLPTIRYKIGTISTANNTFYPDIQFSYSIHNPSNTKDIIYGEISITNTTVTTLIGANKLTFTKSNSTWTPTWSILNMAQSSQLEDYPVIVSVRKVIE